MGKVIGQILRTLQISEIGGLLSDNLVSYARHFVGWESSESHLAYSTDSPNCDEDSIHETLLKHFYGLRNEEYKKNR